MLDHNQLLVPNTDKTAVTTEEYRPKKRLLRVNSSCSLGEIVKNLRADAATFN